MKNIYSLLLALSLVIFLAPQISRADDSEYRAFGEKAGVTKLVDDFMLNLQADSRTEPFFAHVNRETLKTKLVEQFCQLLGGPCEYTGHKMKTTHKGLEIKKSDFNALVEDLQKAMEKNNISPRAQNKFLAILAPMYRDVIE